MVIKIEYHSFLMNIYDTKNQIIQVSLFILSDNLGLHRKNTPVYARCRENLLIFAVVL
jgi:hypothetical protein